MYRAGDVIFKDSIALAFVADIDASHGVPYLYRDMASCESALYPPNMFYTAVFADCIMTPCAATCRFVTI